MNLIDHLLALSWAEVVIAAVLACIITCAIRAAMRFNPAKMAPEKTFAVHSLNMPEVYARCKELFPIESIEFHGKQFRRGMMIKVTTLQKNVIEGEFIGMNRVNLLCIRTGNQIIAHQLEKIAEITAE